MNYSKIKEFRRFINKVGAGQLFLNYIIKKFRRDQCFPFSLHFTSQVIAPENISYGVDFTTKVSLAVSGNCYFQALNGISLGENCLIAPGVKIISSNHGKNSREFKKASPIKVGNNVWIGANVVILPGVEIGDACIIGAGSIVTKSFIAPNKIIAGNPAKILSDVK